MTDKEAKDYDLAPPRAPNLSQQELKTPPNQFISAFGGSPKKLTKFDANTNPNTNYQEVQNLPTPLTVNIHGGSSTNSGNVSSPLQRLYPFREEEEEIHDRFPLSANMAESSSIPTSRDRLEHSSSNSTSDSNQQLLFPSIKLNVPKTRRVLGENNDSKVKAPVRFTSEFKYNDPTSTQFEINKFKNIVRPRYDGEFANQLDIRPVERVVSVPIKRNNIPASLSKHPQKESLQIQTKHLTTYITYDIETGAQQDWTVIKEIGHGSFSRVYLCNDMTTAIKVTDLRFMKEPEDIKLRIQNSLTRELDILKSLNHPNIVCLFGAEIYPKHSLNSVERVTMALNYAKGGNLYDLVLNDRSNMSVDLIEAIFSQITNAIYYIHVKHSVCHRDIKLENILLLLTPTEMLNGEGLLMAQNGESILMLTDFGLSKKLLSEDELLTTRCGSEDYVSPELLLGMKYNGKQNDCWSLGVVLYTILESRLPFDPLPFESNGKSSARRSRPSHRIAMIAWNWYFMKNEGKESEWASAKEITKMLLTKRNKRANIETIWNHPWVQKFII